MANPPSLSSALAVPLENRAGLMSAAAAAATSMVSGSSPSAATAPVNNTANNVNEAASKVFDKAAKTLQEAGIDLYYNRVVLNGKIKQNHTYTGFFTFAAKIIGAGALHYILNRIKNSLFDKEGYFYEYVDSTIKGATGFSVVRSAKTLFSKGYTINDDIYEDYKSTFLTEGHTLITNFLEADRIIRDAQSQKEERSQRDQKHNATESAAKQETASASAPKPVDEETAKKITDAKIKRDRILRDAQAIIDHSSVQDASARKSPCRKWIAICSRRCNKTEEEPEVTFEKREAVYRYLAGHIEGEEKFDSTIVEIAKPLKDAALAIVKLSAEKPEDWGTDAGKWEKDSKHNPLEAYFKKHYTKTLQTSIKDAQAQHREKINKELIEEIRANRAEMKAMRAVIADLKEGKKDPEPQTKTDAAAKEASSKHHTPTPTVVNFPVIKGDSSSDPITPPSTFKVPRKSISAPAGSTSLPYRGSISAPAGKGTATPTGTGYFFAPPLNTDTAAPSATGSPYRILRAESDEEANEKRAARKRRSKVSEQLSTVLNRMDSIESQLKTINERNNQSSKKREFLSVHTPMNTSKPSSAPTTAFSTPVRSPNIHSSMVSVSASSISYSTVIRRSGGMANGHTKSPIRGNHHTPSFGVQSKPVNLFDAEDSE